MQPINSLLSTSYSSGTARRLQSNELVLELNVERNSIRSIIESRAARNWFGKNLQEIMELLSYQAGTQTRLDYLDFRGVGSVDPYFLKEVLSPILAPNAQVHVEFEVDCDQRQDLEYVYRRIEEYRDFFINQENRFFYLKISNSPVAVFPANAFDFLEGIRLENFPNLDRADFGNATEVYCLSCDALQTVIAPQADEVFFGDCPLLIQVAVEEASVVIFAGCNTFVGANFPEAEEVQFRNCDLFAGADFPKVTNATFENCPALLQLELLAAEKATFDSCPLLGQLDLPSVEEVELINCQSLGVVSLPNAETVTVLDCPNIQLTDLPEDAQVI